MDDEFKALVVFIGCATLILGGLIGATVNAGAMDHDFDVKCIQANKSIKYRTLEGQSTSVKECV